MGGMLVNPKHVRYMDKGLVCATLTTYNTNICFCDEPEHDLGKVPGYVGAGKVSANEETQTYDGDYKDTKGWVSISAGTYFVRLR